MAAEVDRTLVPAQSGRKFGYINAESKKFVIPPEYADAAFFVDGVAIVRLAHPKSGMALIDRQNKVLLAGYPKITPAYTDGSLHPNYFDQSEGIHPRTFVVEADERKGVFQADAGWLLPLTQAQSIRFISGDSFYHDGKLVLEGKTVPLPARFVAERVERNFVQIRQIKGEAPKTGLIRPDGSAFIPTSYDEIGGSASGWWLASRITGRLNVKKQSGNQDYISTDIFDQEGRLAFSFTSRHFPEITGDIFSYQSKGRGYAFDLAAGVSLPVSESPAEVSALPPLPEGYASIARSNFPGRFIIEKRAKGSSAYGLADEQGRILREAQFLNAFYFNRLGQAVAYDNNLGRHGVINADGSDVIPFAYRSLYPLTNDGKPMYIAQQGEFWGALDAGGNTVLPFSYGHIHSISSQSGWYRLENPERSSSGIFHADGVRIEPGEYDNLEPAGEVLIGYKMLRTPPGGDQFSLLRRDGVKLGDYSHLRASVAAPTVFIVQSRGKYGLADQEGKLALPLRYERIIEVDPVYFMAVDDNGIVVYVDRAGTEYRPLD